jgi:hypothetical protein
VTRGAAPGEKNAARYDGLYRSTDGGKGWTAVCWYFHFNEVFIHPTTGQLYAVIQETSLGNDTNGYLVLHYTDRVVSSSDDGRHWRDIMKGLPAGPGTRFGTFFVDSDHPDRVCVAGSNIRRVILQSTDDEYSDWRVFEGSSWFVEHPADMKMFAASTSRR